MIREKNITSDIESNVSNKKKTLNELDGRVNDRKDKLHEKLTLYQKSEKTLDDLLQWLCINEKTMKSLPPLSEDMNVLLKLRDFSEVIFVWRLVAKHFFLKLFLH